jgi:hypothetical protein
MRLEAQQAGWVGKHWAWVRLGKALSLEDVQEQVCVTAAHVGVALAIFGRIAEIAPSIDHLLGRAAADAELETPAADQISRARILGHVEGVLVANVDDGGADLDMARLGAERRQQREGRGGLAREMMDAEARLLCVEFLGRHGKVDCAGISTYDQRSLDIGRYRSLMSGLISSDRPDDEKHPPVSNKLIDACVVVDLPLRSLRRA